MNVDKILEERGKIYGDSEKSGEFFLQGTVFLANISNLSKITRPASFMGHMYMAMFKMIRFMHNPYHQDNYDDLLGYLKLAMKALKQNSKDSPME